MIRINTDFDDYTIVLRTERDTLLLDRADIDDAIRALCELRFAQDPENYERFVCELMPRMSGEYTFRDLHEPHSGIVSAEGRTATVSMTTSDVASLCIPLVTRLNRPTV